MHFHPNGQTRNAPHTMEHMHDSSTDMLDKVDLESAINRLTEEEREIVVLWIWHDKKFHEIGEIIGHKYRGEPLTASAIRYHKNRILVKLKGWMDSEGP